MRINRKMKFKYVIVMCLLAGLTANSSAKLNPRQASLRDANVMTVDVVCSKEVKDTDLKQQDIQENIAKQLEQAGVKIMPVQLWGTVPGRCRSLPGRCPYLCKKVDLRPFQLALCRKLAIRKRRLLFETEDGHELGLGEALRADSQRKI